jgi:hypothetical protein
MAPRQIAAPEMASSRASILMFMSILPVFGRPRGREDLWRVVDADRNQFF